MRFNGKHYRTVWMEGSRVFMIDQNQLPFSFKIFEAKTYMETCHAIETMLIRGAGAIGVAAGFAMAQAYMQAHGAGSERFILNAKKVLESTRPTARNLFYAAERAYKAGKVSIDHAIDEAQKLAEENIIEAKKIGEFGDSLIKDGFRIETHCNAGWLAFVDYGSALSPVYTAHANGKQLFIYVGETRPRSQGSRLTAWELKNENIPHAIISDNAGAFFMSKGEIDLIIVGADRIAANGDVANKIGTLEKAIVAKHFGVPFYVAAPLSTFDLATETGKDISIEQRSQDEVIYQTGLDEDGNLKKILVANPGSKALNPAFDVTPADFITGIITEKGIIKANKSEIKKLFSP